MSKSKLSLEELAVEHDVDLDFVRLYSIGLSQANEDHSRWVAWRTPVMVTARRIEAMVRAHTKEDVHPLDRPGLFISQRDQLGEDLQLFIDVPGYPWLSLKFDPFEGVSLCANVDSPSVASGRVHATAHLERSWSSQSPIVQDKWPALFESVEYVLSCVHDALQANTPLGATPDWPTALRDHLAQSSSVDRVDLWAHWVNTWGTPEMMHSFNLVDGLFDFVQDPKAWREQLLHAWEVLDVAPQNLMENWDPTVFINT